MAKRGAASVKKALQAYRANRRALAKPRKPKRYRARPTGAPGQWTRAEREREREQALRAIEADELARARRRTDETAEKALADRERGLVETRARCELARKRLGEVCKKRREGVRTHALERIEQAFGAEREAAETTREGRRLRAHAARVNRPQRLRGESRLEADEEVRRNVEGFDPSLVSVWDMHRAQFKGTPHQRFERFVEWTETADEAIGAARWREPTDAELAADLEREWRESA